MRNVEAKVQGSKLVIEVDLNEKGEPSTTGKTLVIATTGGNIPVPGYKDQTIKIGLNVTRPNKG